MEAKEKKEKEKSDSIKAVRKRSGMPPESLWCLIGIRSPIALVHIRQQ